MPRLRLAAVGVVIAALFVGIGGQAAAAYPTGVRVDLRVLVITDGGSPTDAIAAALRREGAPYTTVDLTSANRPVITDSYLSDTVNGVARAKFQGVVVPNEAPLPEAEMASLVAYEQQFGIRQVNAYTWAHPGVGLNYAQYAGAVDGMTASVTTAGASAGFGYLAGSFPLDDLDASISESWGYLATPLAADPATGASFTPLVTAPIPGSNDVGSLIGVWQHDSRSELVITFGSNQNQLHAKTLAHGIVSWLTQGVNLGIWRNWFSVHIDDIFLPDARWHTEANCTVGDSATNCNPTADPNIYPYNEPIRMTPADVDYLINWQKARGMKLDLAFNGFGSVEAISDNGSDPLTTKFVNNRRQFRWLNHTYTHHFLGCVQDFTVIPWRCATDPNTGATLWVSRATIRDEINQNLTWAANRGINFDSRELVTGEHSGLRTLPQQPEDNPNLGPAFADTGVLYTGSDNSREPAQRAIGPARTVPRYPMNIYYNVGKAAEEVDEYNWIYTSRADGGSGICEDNPGTTTCIAPLSTDTGFASYIVPIESRIALTHALSVDPRPHYAHQSNITEDRILYPVLDSVLSEYRSRYGTNTPLLNPRTREIGVTLQRKDDWLAAVAAGKVEAYVQDGVLTVRNLGTRGLFTPVTVPPGTYQMTLGIPLVTEFGEAYGGQRSAYVNIPRGGSVQFKLP
jgi:hypothetical protein